MNLLVVKFKDMDMELNEAVVERIVRESMESLLAEVMSADDVYAKYYADMDKGVFDAAVKADPTSNGDHAGRYVKWILNLAKAGKWKPGDSYETRDALSKFHRMRGSLQNGDINAYPSVKAVLDAVSGMKTRYGSSLSRTRRRLLSCTGKGRGGARQPTRTTCSITTTSKGPCTST